MNMIDEYMNILLSQQIAAKSMPPSKFREVNSSQNMS